MHVEYRISLNNFANFGVCAAFFRLCVCVLCWRFVIIVNRYSLSLSLIVIRSLGNFKYIYVYFTLREITVRM